MSVRVRLFLNEIDIYRNESGLTICFFENDLGTT